MRALVVVPTYNEVASLERVALGALAAGAELLIVDDASPDGTGALADRLAAQHPGVHALHRPAKSGLGSAYRKGFAWGLEHSFDLLCEMDGDLSHDPADLPRLLEAASGADLVVGSRYVPGGSVVDWPAHRRALSRLGNRYARAATGLPVADATSGFRVFRRQALESVGLSSVRSDGYSFQIEMALRTWRMGFRIVEVPITFVERRAGASKISRAIVLEALWRIMQWGLRGPRRPPAAPHPASIAAAP